MSEVIIKHDNIKIVVMEKEDRRELVDEIIQDSKYNNPMFISFITPTQDASYGDVIINDIVNDETGEVFYDVNIVAVSEFMEEYIPSAIRLGMKELLGYMKTKKITTNSMYILQTNMLYMLDEIIEFGMVVEDVLYDFKLNDKVTLWLENIIEVVDINEIASCECGKHEKCKCGKDKKKNKKKDKKNKKKGKKK